MPDITYNIKNKSSELGFSDIGFAKAEILTEEIENYMSWIDSGYHATMAWMEKNIEKRANPAKILEAAKTVIVTAYNYNTGIDHPDTIPENHSKISRYAWGSDYHDIILPKLKELGKYIESLDDNIHTWAYVDTGPVLEKVWAEKAGIGWQGKNSLIISREFGTYFFIGIIFTNLGLKPSTVVTNRCGKCTKCIEECPTGAIISPKVIDSNKCLSYLTIELKAENNIPEEFSDKNSEWLYGCDICQEVCPWNSKLKLVSEEKLFLPRNNETTIDINNIMEMDILAFRERFRKSPIKRPKLLGLQRNARALKEYFNSNNSNKR